MTKPSRAASAQYGVPCPTCRAFSNAPCRTLRTGRITDTHMARIANVDRIAREVKP